MTHRSRAAATDDAARSFLRVAVLLAAPLVLAACDSDKCYRMGYEKSGTTSEQGRADLAMAMQEAERRYPMPGGAVPPEVVNQVKHSRVQATSQEMQRRGYAPVKIPVDCDTGAALKDD